MIYSYKRFLKLQRLAPRVRLARLLACAAIAPFALAVVYVVVMTVIGGLWLLMSQFGNPEILTPYFCVSFTFAALYFGLERRRTRKLYRQYLATQAPGDLRSIVHSPDGEFAKIDRRMAADALQVAGSRNAPVNEPEEPI